MSYQNIPAELKNLPQWVVRKGKRPYDPRSGGDAKAGQPETWATYGQAVYATGYDGIGFEFAEGGGIVGIDLDTVRDPKTGFIAPEAAEIIRTLDSYTEISPSGYGFHIYIHAAPNLRLPWHKAPLPENGIERFEKDSRTGKTRKKKPEIEVYNAGRYFTVTGNRYGERRTVEERRAELAAVLNCYSKTQAEPQGAAATSLPTFDSDKLHTGLEKDQKFRSLWNGDRPNGNESGDDQALMNKLAYWCGKDETVMIAAFTASPHCQSKDAAHLKKAQRADYLSRTAKRAIRDCTGTAAESDAQYRTERARQDFSPLEVDALAKLKPEKNTRYRYNDIGNGNLFADWAKELARFVPEKKQWYFYNGKVWKPDTGSLKAMQLCKKLADMLLAYALKIEDETKRQSYLKHVTKWQIRRNRETILKDATDVYPVRFNEFDADPFLFNCKNGTLDLRTRHFRPHSPGDMLSLISGVRYDPNARCARWEQFISEIMQGDQERAIFLQKALGYALTGDTEFECFFILYGATSRNGKGTSMETYARLMGDYGRAARPETIALKPKVNGAAPSEDLARLAGARFVNISEPDKGLVLSAALVKSLTGNDTITARLLHENSIEYRPQFKLFINTNHLPQVTDVTLFSSGRVKLIPFERHFSESERDTGLKKELSKAENLSGILNWCLDGLWLLRETGFEMPASVQAATDAYKKASDKIGRFIEEMFIPDPRGEMPTTAAYEAYKQWCFRNGQLAESMEKFKAEISNYAEVKRKRPRGASREQNPQALILGYKMACVPVCAGLLL